MMAVLFELFDEVHGAESCNAFVFPAVLSEVVNLLVVVVHNLYVLETLCVFGLKPTTCHPSPLSQLVLIVKILQPLLLILKRDNLILLLMLS